MSPSNLKQAKDSEETRELWDNICKVWQYRNVSKRVPVKPGWCFYEFVRVTGTRPPNGVSVPPPLVLKNPLLRTGPLPGNACDTTMVSCTVEFADRPDKCAITGKTPTSAYYASDRKPWKKVKVDADGREVI